MKKFNVAIILFLFMALACHKVAEKKSRDKVNTITIFTIGDSTMANKKKPNENPERGWCQLLPQFLSENATLQNHAVNGRSSRSFILEKRWDTVFSKLKKGDYVFIQFGHNDQKKKSPNRYTNPFTAYRNNLIKFVEETRLKGANPVLFTSIVRRKFNEFGTLIDTHGVYPQIVRLVAKEFKVPLVDLQYLTEQLEESYGVENSKKLHLHYLPNQISYYPKGKIDNTHLSVLGATEVAKLAVTALNKNVKNFSNYIKKEQ